MKLIADGQEWQLAHDPDFVAGKRLKRRAREQRLTEMETEPIDAVERAADMYRLLSKSHAGPNELKIMGDELTRPWQQSYPVVTLERPSGACELSG